MGLDPAGQVICAHNLDVLKRVFLTSTVSEYEEKKTQVEGCLKVEASLPISVTGRITSERVAYWLVLIGTIPPENDITNPVQLKTFPTQKLPLAFKIALRALNEQAKSSITTTKDPEVGL